MTEKDKDGTADDVDVDVGATAGVSPPSADDEGEAEAEAAVAAPTRGGIVYDDSVDERAHSFRQRRLTYTRHHPETAAAAAAAAAAALLEDGIDLSDNSDGDDDIEGQKEQMTTAAGEAKTASTKRGGEALAAEEGTTTTTEDRPHKRLRVDVHDIDSSARPTTPTTAGNDGTGAGAGASQQKLEPRVVHAGEILRKPPTPGTEKAKLLLSRSRLYHPPHNLPHWGQDHDEGEHDGAAAADAGAGAGAGHGGDEDGRNNGAAAESGEGIGHDDNVDLEGGGGLRLQMKRTATTEEASTPGSRAKAHMMQRQPSWKKKRQRKSLVDDHLLPFPRSIVGTYSCHGVEPVYDSDYEHDEEEEEDDGIDRAPTTTASPTAATSTTVAKINQDRGGVAFPYGNCSRTALFAAFDGHGDGGEHVAQYALHEVQRRLAVHPKFDTDLSQAFVDTFVGVDESLSDVPDIEPMYSGATACVALLRDTVLTVSNCGDSRAVLARRQTGSRKSRKHNNGEGRSSGSGSNDEEEEKDYDEEANLTAIDLTVDQNPDSPGEQERIESLGGYVSPPPEPGLSARVWLDPDHTQIGLAMSRSIGDHAVKPVGVIAEPVVSTWTLDKEHDDFVIIATDGVWEFVSSDEAVSIVSRHLKESEKGGEKEGGEGSASDACRALIEAAAAKWHEVEGDYRDDITALVVRLKKLWGEDDDGGGGGGGGKKEKGDGEEKEDILGGQ